VRPPVVFAVAHLAGTLVGLPSGALLPWWISGAPAWVLAGLVLWLRPFGPTDRQWERAFTDRGPSQVGWRVRLLNEQHAQRVASLAHGLFWGCLAGSLATSFGTAVTRLVWSYEDHGYGAVVAVVMSLGWLVGSATEDEAAAPTSPMLTGLGLYLVVAGLCLLPVLWEVL